MTTENKSPYRRGADDGFYFGIYLSILFFASVFSLEIGILGLLTMIMTLGVPFVIYYFLRRTYVDERGKSPLSSLWMQGIMIFICGSLISGMSAMIYLKWINPDFIIGQVNMAIELYGNSGWPQGEEIANTLQRMIDNHLLPSAISLVIAFIWMAMFSGSILSLIMSLIVRLHSVGTSERRY